MARFYRKWVEEVDRYDGRSVMVLAGTTAAHPIELVMFESKVCTMIMCWSLMWFLFFKENTEIFSCSNKTLQNHMQQTLQKPVSSTTELNFMIGQGSQPICLPLNTCGTHWQGVFLTEFSEFLQESQSFMLLLGSHTNNSHRPVSFDTQTMRGVRIKKLLSFW